MSTTLHLTLAEYDQMVKVGAFEHLQRKVELIRGEIVAMNPAGPLHDYLVTCLITWSMKHLDPSLMMISSQTGLDLPSQVSRPEPDVMWLRLGNYRSSHPRANDVYLAIEVAHSSLVYDLEEKRKLYASAEIVEYWIVDGLANCIHVFTNPDGGDYTRRQIYKVGETLVPQIAPQAELDLTQLFA